MAVLSHLRLNWTLWSKTHKCFYLWGINYNSKDMVTWSKETKSLKCDKWLLVNWAIVSDNVCAFSFSCQLWSETFTDATKSNEIYSYYSHCEKICALQITPHFCIEKSRLKNITGIGPAIALLQGGLLQIIFPFVQQRAGNWLFQM